LPHGAILFLHQEDFTMTEENRRQVERVRDALGEFLDRLSKEVIDNLARSKQVGPSPRHTPIRALSQIGLKLAWAG
jgi:hypothetical protein